MPAIEDKLELKRLLLGAAALAAGIVLLVVGVWSELPGGMSQLALPGWALGAAGAATVLYGALLSARSVSKSRCVACERPLDHAEAHFPAGAEEDIVLAVKRLDTATLTQTPMVESGAAGPRITLTLEYCNGCRQVAELKVVRESAKRHEDLIPPCVLTGPHVDALAEVIEAHAATDPAD